MIYGQTGSGKSDLAEKIAEKTGGIIINMDMAQLYQPISVGTAKPEWQKSHIKQYLFDLIEEPVDFSAGLYRKKVSEVIEKYHTQTIILVGGTGFYLFSIIFKIAHNQENIIQNNKPDQANYSWQLLNDIDPIRAASIHPHDTYRITRALNIFFETGIAPSEYNPVFSPLSNDIRIIYTFREKIDLQERINNRLNKFFKNNFVQEVANLNSFWREFVLKKKFIGYPEVLEMLAQETFDEEVLKKKILVNTLCYAKKQQSFWRNLKKKLIPYKDISYHEVNLTFNPIDLYINTF